MPCRGRLIGMGDSPPHRRVEGLADGLRTDGQAACGEAAQHGHRGVACEVERACQAWPMGQCRYDTSTPTARAKSSICRAVLTIAMSTMAP
jgi:hypothetical protein